MYFDLWFQELRSISMNISLSPEWAHFVDASVDAGPFKTPEEVIHAALRLLKAHELRPLPVVVSESHLEAALLDALKRGTSRSLTATDWSQLRMVIDQIAEEER